MCPQRPAHPSPGASSADEAPSTGADLTAASRTQWLGNGHRQPHLPGPQPSHLQTRKGNGYLLVLRTRRAPLSLGPMFPWGGTFSGWQSRPHSALPHSSQWQWQIWKEKHRGHRPGPSSGGAPACREHILHPALCTDSTGPPHKKAHSQSFSTARG